MALHAKAIKSKINSVENIKKITRAMELVSVSKMQKATDRTMALRTYAQLALEILTHIAQDQVVRHPLLEHGDGNKTLVVVVGSDRGLCGSYNANIQKKVEGFVRRLADDGKTCDFVTIGKNAERFVRSLDGEIVGTFTDFTETISIDNIGGLKHLVLEQFKSNDYTQVVVGYTHFISALKYIPRIRQILPISTEQIEKLIDELEIDEDESVMFESESMSQYLFEPSEEAVLSAILPQLTGIRLYRALLESFASEHSARMFAMKNATENAEEMIDDLNLSYNRARQANITREISEIAAGAEAMNNS